MIKLSDGNTYDPVMSETRMLTQLEKQMVWKKKNADDETLSNTVRCNAYKDYLALAEALRYLSQFLKVRA